MHHHLAADQKKKRDQRWNQEKPFPFHGVVLIS
jgi:hypothetical protein